MKSRGYEWNFDEFADKYSSLDINDLVSLYEWQNWKAVVQSAPEVSSETSYWPQSVIAWANPTTEVGWQKLNEMTSEQAIQWAKSQPWFNK
jgi:hypothetical protein